MKRLFLKNLILAALLVAFSSQLFAQTCPQGKVTVIWVNGILVGPEIVNGIITKSGQQVWAERVQAISDNFMATHPGMKEAGCVQFKPVYNQSSWALPDLTQSTIQLFVDLARGRINLEDPDMRTLLTTIGTFAIQGKVILAGHSQGTLYADLAYEFIRSGQARAYVPSISFLPDNSKLEIVNIATPTNKVSDNNGRYTTVCGDIILAAGGLKANVNSESTLCAFQGLSIAKHELDAYMAPGSLTQKQIYADLDLALRIPDSGCGRDSSCQLNDNYSDGDYITNFIADPYGMGLVKEDSGALQLSASSTLQPASNGVYLPSKSIVRTRRVFTGPFTASFRWNYIPVGNSFAKVNLVRTSDGAMTPDFALTTGLWPSLSFIRTESQISILKNGALVSEYQTGRNDEHYLRFELKSDTSNTIASTLLIKDLSVSSIASVTSHRDTPSDRPEANSVRAQVLGGYTGAISCTLNGASITAPFSVVKTPGSYTLICNAPNGYNVVPNNSSPSVATLPPGGVLTFGVMVTPKPTTITLSAVPDANVHHTAINCSINGGPSYSITYGKTILTDQTPGTKSIVCSIPLGYTLNSITPSATQTLVANSNINFQVNLNSPPPLTLTSLTTDPASPKVNTNIGVTLYGNGFVNDTKAYVCTTSATSSCVETDSIIWTTNRITFRKPIVVSTAGTIYFRVRNVNPTPLSDFSNALPMVVIK